MTETPSPRRRRRTTKKSTAGARPTIQVRDEPAAIAPAELTALQQRWTREMKRAAAYAGDQMIRVVLGKHAPDADGLCGAEKCRRAIWPCPPADSVIRKLP